MARKDKEQSDRFIKKAKELESDESGKAFEFAFKKLAPPAIPRAANRPRRQPKRR